MRKNWLAKILPSQSESQIDTFQPPAPEVMERVLLSGDLSTLQPRQRLSYYESVARSLGLNPLTKPFEYITLNGKLTLYARKDCTEQLRRRWNIDLKILSRDIGEGVITVVAQARMPNGRQDESIGSVVLPSNAEGRANAMMKAETKAKRRVTLSICGLGMFDESELETMYQPNGNSVEERVKKAVQNRTEAEPEPEVSPENYGEVECHIGKAEGQMLGKKVSEIHPNILQWLNDHFGENGAAPQWGNPTTERDSRLKKAVELALADLRKE